MSRGSAVRTDLALVRVRLEGRERDFDVPPGANLLGSALKHKVRIDHICRVGLCGACQVRVLQGGENLSEPTDAERLLLDDVPLGQGVRLACQAKVIGDVFVDHAKLKT